MNPLFKSAGNNRFLITQSKCLSNLCPFVSNLLNLRRNEITHWHSFCFTLSRVNDVVYIENDEKQWQNVVKQYSILLFVLEM